MSGIELKATINMRASGPEREGHCEMIVVHRETSRQLKQLIYSGPSTAIYRLYSVLKNIFPNAIETDLTARRPEPQPEEQKTL